MFSSLARRLDDRSEPRDETLHRTIAHVGTGTPLPLVVVNLSPGGFMARTPRDLPVGASVTLTLPHAGTCRGEVRWCLGGRIGCRLYDAIPPAAYPAVLAAMR